MFHWSHGNYPLLAPSVVAAVWSLTSSENLRVAQVVATIVTFATVVLFALALYLTASRALHWQGALMAVLAAWGATATVVAGVTNGYVDHLWSAAITSAAIVLLVWRPSDAALRLGSDHWLWVLASDYLLALVGTYLISPRNIHWHLRTFVDRTSMALIYLALTSVSLLLTTGLTGLGVGSVRAETIQRHQPTDEGC